MTARHKYGPWSMAAIEQALDRANAAYGDLIAERNDPLGWAAAQADAREALHVHLEFYPLKEDV